ncbi:RNA methyltransferase [Pedobacter yulinensis]|uniref:RNA methyltransferase n=1 Tax=Pedobacter yulinensis TaxID=2126353 RepID=A0A2T3HKS8_9SPHI|nr:RNA methyltransferase [Pedobacter yulinensis]PST83034.1 RNA methyltransferase [Pedobacter yulinensis]
MRKLKLDELNRPDLATYRQQEKLPVVIVLDNVRSLHNVGSVFRTADGFAVEKVILCGITGQPPHREIEKTALGATASVSWEYQQHTADAIAGLRQAGYTIAALEQAAGSTMLHGFIPDPRKKFALILGNEVDGVSDAAMALIDHCLEIPQFGTKHSFNVVISAGIVLWDFYAKMRLGYGAQGA